MKPKIECNIIFKNVYTHVCHHEEINITKFNNFYNLKTFRKFH